MPGTGGLWQIVRQLRPRAEARELRILRYTVEKALVAPCWPRRLSTIDSGLNEERQLASPTGVNSTPISN